MHCDSQQTGNVAHFPCFREAGMMKEKVPEYDAVLSNLFQEFDSRFEDFRHNASDFEWFVQPFTISVDTVSDDLQMEPIELQCDSELKHKFRSLPLTDFYKRVPTNRLYNPEKPCYNPVEIYSSLHLADC
ncbi:general transcription factor II-I repeat domain-containing protein 2-like isoform X2 [Ictalurus furcatus]|uniref:general transcription factor II-I repeat domain-containing protein 2-like isoform X2 n=1 Tax=Ictalurus furcatus TaxID=66913 RepID=UPI0023507D26|nr:general transcription factor II-I repeat domain-containing protein 2-like isoform X2 [Ictalurus furcatus]